MIILGIDPGPTVSGVVVYQSDSLEVLFSGEVESWTLVDVLFGKFGYISSDPRGNDLKLLNELIGVCTHGAIEDIEPMGKVVGRDVFETCKFVGRFGTAWRHRKMKKAYEVGRGDIKVTICGGHTFIDSHTGKRKRIGDSNVWAALKDRFPGVGGGSTPSIGTKKNPGPLYGVKGHARSALAVAVTHAEHMQESGQ